nr:malate dehydrogenase, cytoplasmic-like [Penaeus vannamei]
MAEPVRVCVTGAAGQIGYSLVLHGGLRCCFRPETPVILHLLDITPMMNVLNGVCMEISDCALPCVRDVIPTDDPAVAFKTLMLLSWWVPCPARRVWSVRTCWLPM